MNSRLLWALGLILLGCSPVASNAPPPTPSPVPETSPSPLTREQRLSQDAKPVIEALEAFRKENGSYPFYYSMLFAYLAKFPDNIAYKWIYQPADGYELAEVLPNGQLGCIYTSFTKTWKCPD